MLYFLGGKIAQKLEDGFGSFPLFIIVSKMIPPGIDSTMFSLSMSIIILSKFSLRNLTGALINDNFVHVSKANMENYYVLKIIQMLTSCIPLLYLWCLVPTLKEA